MARAPRDLAIWTAAEPTAPAAPMMTAVSPEEIWAAVIRADQAVTKVSPADPADSMEIVAGLGAAASLGRRMNWE